MQWLMTERLSLVHAVYSFTSRHVASLRADLTLMIYWVGRRG